MASPQPPSRTAFCCASLRVRRSASAAGFLTVILPAIFLLAFSANSASAAPRPSRHHVQDPWEHAVAVRQELEALPPEQRTRERYEEALDAFRVIYHQNPTAAKAPAAVAAVADLLAEKGRVLADQRSLRAAIGQYEFLREQYPDSPQVDNALLLEGEICRQDLKDIACAEEKFRGVVEESPGTSFAEQAAMELKELEPPKQAKAPTSVPKNAASRSTPKSTSAKGAVTRPTQPATQETASSADRSAERLPASQPPPPAATQNSVSGNVSDKVSGNLPSNTSNNASQNNASQFAPLPQPEQTSATSATQKLPGTQRVVMITGMRHWSNPTSTRIAIDLGGQVQYEAARVPNPDRIFFDLHGARLASSLNGHQVEVIDDGYLKRIRAAQFKPDVTRVVLDVTDVSQYSAFLLPNPWRLIIDIHSEKGAVRVPANSVATIGPSQPAARPSADTAIAEVAKLSNDSGKVTATAGPTSGPVSARVPGTIPAPDTPASKQAHPAPVNPTVGPALSSGQTTTTTDNSASASGKKRPKSKPGAPAAPAEMAAAPHAADPDSDGQRSLVRALGLKVGRIVIDAGHGGHDSGTLGPGGIQEKDVVLDVALRVGKLLHQRLGAEIVYTRSDDTFIPLETRTAIANKAQADLFLSIHANSSPEPDARGVETYYLNFTSDPNALDVAARENAVSTQSVHQLSDLVRKITLKDKIDESREFAADVDAGLYAGLKAGNPGLKDRGVKKAPFVVLIGAQMPSILAEISFLTNPDDAEQLQQGSYRQRIAESLGTGVERYLHGLSGTRPVEKNTGKSATRSAEKSSADNAAEGIAR
jgi:N-acetylmuramoyl-L-alanine amidase